MLCRPTSVSPWTLLGANSTPWLILKFSKVGGDHQTFCEKKKADWWKTTIQKVFIYCCVLKMPMTTFYLPFWSPKTRLIVQQRLKMYCMFSDHSQGHCQWQFSSQWSQVGRLPQSTLSGQSHWTLLGSYTRPFAQRKWVPFSVSQCQYFAQLNSSGYQPSLLPTQMSAGWWSAGPQSAWCRGQAWRPGPPWSTGAWPRQPEMMIVDDGDADDWWLMMINHWRWSWRW